MTQKVGIVVPSLGQRPDYLEKCLRSIRAAGEAHVLLVAPSSLDISNLQSLGLVDSVVADAGAGLAAAINLGIDSLPDSVEYINWLGDDDLLKPDSLNSCTDALDMKPDALMVFGACEYIDTQGDVVWNNRSGQWAVTLMRVGPDLIPQPGSLFRRSAFNSVGGLRTNLGWAFDFDLFIRFSKAGKLHYLNQTLASFRWHPESLSVGHRKNSVAEAGKVRVSHLPALLKAISFLWEYPVRTATLIAGNKLSSEVQSRDRTK